jgi:hypothetical protein
MNILLIVDTIFLTCLLLSVLFAFLEETGAAVLFTILSIISAIIVIIIHLR